MGMTETQPLISVVIPAYNESRSLGRVLENLQKQDYKNFELIVVDNNSSDDTAAVAASLGARVIHEPRQGVGWARQTGFAAAKGEVIATTDADTLVPPHWLSYFAKQFQDNPNLVAYGGLYKLYSGPLSARLVFPHGATVLWHIDRLANRGWSLAGANMAVRKDAFLKVGGFNTSMNLNEDADLAQRLKHVGQVEFDRKFLVSTSGRRYRAGLLKGLYGYMLNHVARYLFGKKAFNKLSPVRTESRSPASFIGPVLLIVGILLIFYYYSALAKVVSGIFR